MKLIDHLLDIDKKELFENLKTSYSEEKLDEAFTTAAKLLNSTLLDIEYLKILLYAVDFKSLKFLKSLLKSKILIDDKYYDCFLKLNLNNLVFLEKGYYVVPDDLKVLLLKIFNSSSFFPEYNKYNWLIQCIKFANVFYGIYTLKDVINLINTDKNKIKFYNDEMINSFILKKTIARFEDGHYISEIADDYGVAELLEEQKDKDTYIPTKEEISFYYDEGYINNNNYEKFFKELVKNYCDYYDAKSIITEFFYDVSIGKDISEIIGELTEELIFDDEMESIYFTNMCFDCYNNTNMLLNRGYSPNGLSKKMKL